MCVVVPRNLGKGDPLRVSRCIPPGLWRFFGIEPHPRQQNVRRFDPRIRRSVPAPSETFPDRACSPPRPRDHRGCRWSAIMGMRRPEPAPGCSRLEATGDTSTLPRLPSSRSENSLSSCTSIDQPLRRLDTARSLRAPKPRMYRPPPAVIHIALFAAPIGVAECVSTGYTDTHERFGPSYSHRARPA